jgi:hypothetical protein
MSDPVLTPNFEPVEVAGSVSGSDVVLDICDRLAEKLLLSDSLRESDAYSSYSAQITVTLQLTDVYPTEIATAIQVNTVDPKQPSRAITLDVPTVEADEARARLGLQPSPNLERFADDDAAGAEMAKVAAPTRRRYYTPTGRPRGRPRKA